MLTPELARARIKSGKLRLQLLEPAERDRALQIVEDCLATAREHVGKTRQELEQALSEHPVDARERTLALGLHKLVEDELQFDGAADIDPVELRRELFLRAAELRRALPVGSVFERGELIERLALERGLPHEELERLLYADLRAAQILRNPPTRSAESIVLTYDIAQVQAVLLRAERVQARVRCRAPGLYRALFNNLKFRRLLYTIQPEEDGYRIELDGPFSLFESSTKYGFALAWVLPALLECDALTLTAEVRWGVRRQRAIFEFEHRRRPASHAERADAAWLPEEVQALLQAVVALQTDWQAAPSSAILELPGLGVCVPDLVFTSPRAPRPVYLEVLGYWSRHAVWRRVEMAEQGLSESVLFAASSRLRVSEAVLDDCASASLYVYKGSMSARAVLERVEALASSGQGKSGRRKRVRRAP